MQTSIHIIVRSTDEILPVLGDRAANIAPMLQLYNADMIGGPVSISFGSSSDLAEGIHVADKMIADIIRIRTELQERRWAGFGRPIRPELVELVDMARNPAAFSPHAAAGDPVGEGPDFPASDE